MGLRVGVILLWSSHIRQACSRDRRLGRLYIRSHDRVVVGERLHTLRPNEAAAPGDSSPLPFQVEFLVFVSLEFRARRHFLHPWQVH